MPRAAGVSSRVRLKVRRLELYDSRAKQIVAQPRARTAVQYSRRLSKRYRNRFLCSAWVLIRGTRGNIVNRTYDIRTKSYMFPIFTNSIRSYVLKVLRNINTEHTLFSVRCELRQVYQLTFMRRFSLEKLYIHHRTTDFENKKHL